MKLSLFTIPLIVLSFHVAEAQRITLSNKAPKQTQNKSTQDVLSSSYPKMQHTGNLSQDIKTYNVKKQAWIEAHPIQYKNMTETPNNGNEKARKEREQSIQSRTKSN